MQEDTHATDGRADTAVASHVGALATPRVDVPLTPRADMTATTRDEWLADCGLTSRERAVVRLVMEGRTFQEVAERLGIAPSTAKTYFQRSLTKLGVASGKPPSRTGQKPARTGSRASETEHPPAVPARGACCSRHAGVPVRLPCLSLRSCTRSVSCATAASAGRLQRGVVSRC